MAEFLHNLGAVYMAQHKWNKAEEFLQRSFKLKQAEVGASHPDLSMTLRLLGDLYTRTRRYSEAENQYNQALTLLETAGVEFETRIARILEALGDMYEAAGRKMEATVPFSRAAAIGVRHLDKPDMSAIVEKHAAKLRKAGRSKEASDLEVEVNHARSALRLVINARDRF
jgi:tetratricopeptide (TPR) repeat protein